jgi:hypothetical protein
MSLKFSKITDRPTRSAKSQFQQCYQQWQKSSTRCRNLEREFLKWAEWPITTASVYELLYGLRPGTYGWAVIQDQKLYNYRLKLLYRYYREPVPTLKPFLLQVSIGKSHKRSVWSQESLLLMDRRHGLRNNEGDSAGISLKMFIKLICLMKIRSVNSASFIYGERWRKMFIRRYLRWV